MLPQTPPPSASPTMANPAPADLSPAPAPARRGRGRPPKNPVAAAGAVEAVGEYERAREARIRENMERMQNLGILDLKQTLSQWHKQRKGPSRHKPASPSSPSRRSLRLQSLEPVTHNLRPKETYTEEHEKLLGTCNTPWTLFVDDYGKDGKRIIDLARGQSCHQCHKKTVAHHTSCCKCQIVRGQFCGDCLYTRYGENVLEAKSNPNWICPICRDICNCSKCRARKGWLPTLYYKKVISLGYKSVAHYLITTQRGSANSEDSSSADSLSKLPSAKSEASCISRHDSTVGKPSAKSEASCISKHDDSTVGKEGLDDGETSSEDKKNKATCRQAKNTDGYKDDCRSEPVVTSDSQDDQANIDHGCVIPSKPTLRKRKHVERSLG